MLWLVMGIAVAEPSEVTAKGATLSLHEAEITVTAEHARWDLKAQTGELVGQVSAVQGDLTLRCDTATVHLGDGQGIVRAVARGNVFVQQGDKTASGRQAVLEEGRLELTGEPLLTSGPHRMQGTRIVFVVGEQSIECEGCTLQVGPIE